MADGVLPMDPTEARKVKKNSSRFTLIDGELYRFGFTHPLLVCVHGEKCMRIMAELHEGICGSHIGGRALATRTLRADNGTQFSSHLFKKLCRDVGIQLVFASMEHPQTNGQVESANRVLLRVLKRRLEKVKGSWVEEVPRIV
ncbi:uncharacterized protein [Phaseolus vulgaris]|uniref:uncharacterized protein n=1 Tax=Phaseolus vulgaris TaxID=3885 RepID=UPI0035CA61AC